MFYRIIISLICIFFTTGIIFPDISVPDENSLFQGETMVDTNKIISNALVSNANQKSVSLTGQLQSITGYSMTSGFLKGSTNADQNLWLPATQGNLFLDIRLTQGIKAFADIQAQYATTVNSLGAQSSSSGSGTPSIVSTASNTTTLSLQELFLDANINNAIYFRAGKQALQWGVGNYWSPSDLINIQKQSFYAISGYNQYIEGTYGLKALVPFGTSANLYGFVNMNGAKDPQDMAFAGKAEFLINPVEFAGAIWAKNNYHPVYALDVTTRLFNSIDFRGEASFADYDFNPQYSTTNNITYVYGQQYYVSNMITNQFVCKVSVGFTKTFDWDIPQRISITLEFYYKSDGYTQNYFTNQAYRQTISTMPDAYTMSDYYAYNWALISSFAEFLDQNVTLSLNAIGNFVDYSFLIGPTISWNPVYDFTINFSVFGYIGDQNTEYTYNNNGMTVYLTGSIIF